jgi:hypothetical protein
MRGTRSRHGVGAKLTPKRSLGSAGLVRRNMTPGQRPSLVQSSNPAPLTFFQNSRHRAF